ncbi:hypothetical protein SK128_011971, partial [Halocaridina rubra]
GSRSGSTAMVRYNSQRNAVRVTLSRQYRNNHQADLPPQPLSASPGDISLDTNHGLYRVPCLGHYQPTRTRTTFYQASGNTIRFTFSKRANSFSACSYCHHSRPRSPSTYP